MLRFVGPGYALLGLTLLLIWRHVTKSFDKNNIELPLWSRYFVGLYALFFYLLVGALWSAYRDVMLTTRYLDVEETEKFVRQRMEADNETELLKEWREEASLDDFQFLLYFSYTTPLWVCGTFVLCSRYTWLHVVALHKARKQGVQMNSFKADLYNKVIQILGLPFLFGLMAFESVVRMWGVVINYVGPTHHYNGWKTRRHFQIQCFRNCNMVGDIYESHALFTFALIVMKVLKSRLETGLINTRQEIVKQERTVQHLLEVSSVSLPSDARLLTDSLSDDDGPLAIKSSSSLDNLSGSVTKLIARMKGLTTLGIKLFCFTCLFQAAWFLSANSLTYMGFFPEWFGRGDTWSGDQAGYFETPNLTLKISYFFTGCGFVASFAAIGNLVEVERGFHLDLEEFGPILKFLSTKILVTIAFMQQCALACCPPFCWWTETRANLLYGSLLCMECFFIALLHTYAWDPYEAWYNEEGEMFEH